MAANSACSMLRCTAPISKADAVRVSLGISLGGLSAGKASDSISAVAEMTPRSAVTSEIMRSIFKDTCRSLHHAVLLHSGTYGVEHMCRCRPWELVGFPGITYMPRLQWAIGVSRIFASHLRNACSFTTVPIHTYDRDTPKRLMVAIHCCSSIARSSWPLLVVAAMPVKTQTVCQSMCSPIMYHVFPQLGMPLG